MSDHSLIDMLPDQDADMTPIDLEQPQADTVAANTQPESSTAETDTPSSEPLFATADAAAAAPVLIEPAETLEQHTQQNIQIAQTAAHLSSIIKVIGVGGGGGNAVNNMYKEQIGDVRYLVCNTDAKALHDSPVPDRLQIGPGLGAGGRPERGRELAEENLEAIRSIFDDETKMVFITAGMGGGTGTGAAPIVAREAKKKGLLTIGIVTIPFRFEQQRQIDKALDGVEQMEQNVDALLVINNERIRQVYANLSATQAFRKADETLTKAVQSIVEVITMHGINGNNLDFRDVETCLRNGGVAVLSNGMASGENRVTLAIEDALNSPLLNDKDVENSRSFRMAIFFPDDETGKGLGMGEIDEVDEFMKKFRTDVDAKFGWAVDPTLTDSIRVTILASGFRFREEEEGSTEKTLSSEELEKQRERDRRRDEAYGETTKTRIRHNRVFILAPEDLDNDELIANLDALTVYRRSENDLRTLRSLSLQAQAMEVIDN